VVYFQLVTLVSALQAVAGAFINGEANFSKSVEHLKTVRDLLFPELKQETEKKARRTKEIMEQELAKGPLKVKRLDYGKKDRKRR